LLTDAFELLPTAKQLCGSGHDTAFSVAAVVPDGLGLASNPQTLPFQCATNVLVFGAWNQAPTAKQLCGSGHATPYKAVDVAGDGFGLSWIPQFVPFQCCTKLLVPPEVV
jgi:hypothetical protein